ncbi:MAG: hypothetical protein Fur0041_10650 [Bacteroidia bacterium]
MFTGIRNKKWSALLTAVVCGGYAMAQNAQGQAPKEEDVMMNLLANGPFVIMLSTAVLLIFVIYGMAQVVKAGGSYQKDKALGNVSKKIGVLLLFTLSAAALYAQQSPTAASAPVAEEPPFTYWGMGGIIFFIMLSFIMLELLIIYILFRTAMILLDRAEYKAVEHAMKKDEPSFMEKFNASVAIEHEAAIMMDHDYDGIRELDNNLPPWWKYGFFVTIIFAVIYITHFHILHTGKSSLEEYNEQIKDGEKQLAEFRAKSANLVDENTVTLLTDPAELSAGAALFKENCVACHGENGIGGQVGPNLSDKYWIHGGGLSDVFKSIKYGWPDKGMKAWGQEIGPKQISQLTSYIKSLKEVNPPQGKEPQGTLYVEGGAAPADTLKPADSLKADSMPKADSVKK